MRVTYAFATKWYEEWQIAGNAMLHPHTGGERRARIERFLDAMAPAIAKVLLEPPAPAPLTLEDFDDVLVPHPGFLPPLGPSHLEYWRRNQE